MSDLLTRERLADIERLLREWAQSGKRTMQPFYTQGDNRKLSIGERHILEDAAVACSMALRATVPGGGQDAGSVPEQNKQNAVVQDEPQGWVSVKERLPERGVEHQVLTFDPVYEDHIEIAYLRDDIATPTWDSNSGFLQNVSHWMPLPAPPKPSRG